MSKWSEFCADVSKAINSAACTAADGIKSETLKLRLSRKYEELGRITYAQIKSPDANSVSADAASGKVSEIDGIIKAIEDLKKKDGNNSEGKN